MLVTGAAIFWGAAAFEFGRSYVHRAQPEQACIQRGMQSYFSNPVVTESPIANQITYGLRHRETVEAKCADSPLAF